jgi:pimeloyl-ACP methyl ester carboxylesterase/DNA-binding CsgD family transcriptional regulator
MDSLKQQVRFCSSADGTRIAYAVSGKGPPLVLSFGWPTHLEFQRRNHSHHPLVGMLSQRYKVLRYDMRGCGLSDRNAPEFSFDAWLDDFEAVVVASGIDRFPIMGIGTGGVIAIEYAARHPEKVSQVLLLGAFARGRLRRDGGLREIEIANLRYDMAHMGWSTDSHALLQAFVTAWQPGGSAERIRYWCELQKVASTGDNAVRMMQIADNVDVTASARRIQCPTLVIHADRQRVVPIEEGRYCASLIPNARFVQIESENSTLSENEPAWVRLQEELAAFIPAHVDTRLQEPFSLLSSRETEVLELIAQGRDNAQVAASLNLSEKTVRNYITCIFAKLEVENRSQAIVLARDGGFGKSRAT